MADNTNKINVSQYGNGLNTDVAPQNQPQGTQRFNLNTVTESEREAPYPSNEESNEICDSLNPDFIPIGKEYMENNEVIIFSVSKDNTISEIGILDNNCNYTVHVNDEDSNDEDKLGFTVEHQIQARYRLRRGCERTVYFTDDNKKPRYFNFDKPEDFKNSTTGRWEGRRFNLFKEYNDIPEFRLVQVLDNGGVLEPGSYNISIRYVDEGLNPTEWILTSPIINVYNDSTTEDFLSIRGSINSDVDYKKFPVTSKSINVELNNLDDSFPFYQLAFIEANSGTGEVTGVKLSEVIPVSKDFFIYTGENAQTTSVEEEILFSNDVIYRAQSIEQIENRLILANTQGKNVDFCKLQKYASRIKTDMVTKKVITNQINDPRNTKNPTVGFGDMITGGLGYMPGELYSFGIVYVFEDGSLSPVFHIPGKNPNVDSTMVFSPGPDVYPMSNDNVSINNKYIDNDSCSSNNLWGLDSEGDPLNGAFVRHHRFPLRSDLNLPLVKEEEAVAQSFNYYKLRLSVSGTITLPCTQAMIDANECSSLQDAPKFQVRVTYTVDGAPAELILNIDPFRASNPYSSSILSNLYSSNNIVVTGFEESDGLGGFTTVTTFPSPKGLTYTTGIESADFETEGKIFSTEIFGVKFSGVDMPSLVDTNGERIIGYYIVRNERVENEKTILDSAVLVPSLVNNKYISHGMLCPGTDSSRYSNDVFGVIHPEHKFNGREYTNYTNIIQEGNFQVYKANVSKTRYNDVTDGTSYDSEVHKDGNDDGSSSNGMDGFGLSILCRDNYTRFKIRKTFELENDDIKEKFYLKALQSRDINNGANTVYNIAADNRVGMIQTEPGLINPTVENLPYVIFKREIADSYSNFRVLPYYKDSLNMETFTSGVGTSFVFGGDTYVSPMRYVNSVFWDNRLAKRAGRTSAWNYIIGAILIVVGVVLLIFGGSGAIVIGAGLGIIGGGALFISSGVERDNLVKAYYEEYDKGLRETALDDLTQLIFRDNLSLWGYLNDPNTSDGPSDDEIQWFGDCVTDLWFESQVNTSLRNKMVSDAPTFLDAPGLIETGNTDPYIGWEFFDINYEDAVSRYPVSKLENHMNKKLLTYDSKRKDNRTYIGHALGEYYEVNPDFQRRNKQKVYFHLPLEYDCCSDCKEDFPHRVHYSEQSFQEELTDNYRVFLPNNYKDIEGETGEITNVFKIGNNLFIHTREGLWQMPRSYQERVTDQVVSFIGTGSYFEIPPQKVLDDDTGSSAGCQHKWSSLKTPAGYFFVCENQRKIYQFDGKTLKAISNNGLASWFQDNMRLKADEQYYNVKGDLYPYRDNPSNPFGTGYISTYDTKKDRIIFTKKDFLLSDEVVGDSDFEVCSLNGQMTIFPNISQTIEQEELGGWNYIGITDCQLTFEKTIIKSRIEERQITTVAFNTSDIIVWLDTSGSFDVAARNQIKSAINTWLADFSTANPDWTGTLHYLEITELLGSTSERWLHCLERAKTDIYGGSLAGRNIIMLTFVNESEPYYHNGWSGTTIPAPNPGYTSDETTFKTLHGECESFVGLAYPIVFTSNGPTQEYLKHVLSAVKGIPYTLSEFNNLEVNPFFNPSGGWNDLKVALMGSNPYDDVGLDQYGWNVITNRGWSGSGDIITPEQFQEDMDNFLLGVITYETVEVEVTYAETQYKYISGVVVENPVELNSSWTISYSLQYNHWVSWHSYLPNFYINVPEKFYSWKYGNNNLWIHGKEGHYQTFYGTLYPWIVEYVSLSNPLINNIIDNITVLLEASKFNSNLKQFVDINDVFFNKAIFYNSRQCSGLLNIKVKDNDELDYLDQQVQNFNANEIIADRNERNWSINELRDYRVDYTQPIFDSSLPSLQSEYFIDKVLNNASINFEKDWTELESFRDKYLVIRLIFDNFADTKMLLSFSLENEIQSFR